MFETLRAFFAAFFTPSTIERDTLVTAYENAAPGSIESIRAELALTKYDLTHAKDASVKRLHVKDIRVSEKGGINFMGLRRFPVNLYAAELEALIECIEDGRLENFLKTHRNSLSRSKAVDAS